MIRLIIKTVTSPDLSGFEFYVPAGDAFEILNYCEAYSLNPAGVDADDVAAANDAASGLNLGEWLHVEHHIPVDDAEEFSNNVGDE